MPRHKLEFDLPETDFLLFGICSQSRDYRMVWIINKNLGLHLERKNDIVPEGSNRFALFSFENKTTRLKYCLSANKNEGGIFIKELKQVDYLLLIEGNYQSVDSAALLSQLKQSESVLAAYELNPELLKSKHLYFEQ